MSDDTADEGPRPDDGNRRRELPLAAAARRLAAEKAAAAQAAPPRSGRAFQQAPPPAPATQPVPPPPPPPAPAPAALAVAPAYAHYPPPAGPAVAPAAEQALMDPVYSPWWKRVCAALIDGVLISVVSGVVFALAGRGLVETDPVTGTSTFHLTGAYVAAWIFTLVATLAYYAILEGGPTAASVGKTAMHITVRDASTLRPIGYGRAVLRRIIATVLPWLLILPGLLDVLWPLWDDRRQTLHDKFTKSVVVEKA